jgi:hypothetical protein
LGENISSGARNVTSETAQGVQNSGDYDLTKSETNTFPESIRQITSDVYQGGVKAVKYVTPRKDQIKKLLNVLIIISVIILLGIVVYLTCVRYRLVGTALSTNDRPLAAALLTPEIATGVTTLAGML